MKKNIVFIPIETISRELDAKLVMANELLDKNTICFLGQHDMIDSISCFFKNGVYIGKNIFKTYFPADMSIYKNYKKNHHSILWLHEEGGIYPGEPNDWIVNLNELLDASCLHGDDEILTWGDFQKDHYKKNSSVQCFSVGSPRLNLKKNDLLRKLINKFNRVESKDFILINTNFSVANYISNIDYVFKELMHGHDDLKEQHKVIQMYAEEKRNFSYFIEIISELAVNYPNEKFVLRPHPTEGVDTYISAFSIYPNVTISKEYTAVEWIEKSKVLIQNGCTTSIEAYLLGKKVINFYPFESKTLINITRDIGVDTKNYEELESAIFSKDLHAFHDSNIDSFQISNLIDNLKSDYSNSYLISKIKAAISSKHLYEFNNVFLTFRIYISIAFKQFIRALKYYPRYLFPQKQKDYQMAIKHFDGLDRKNINSKIAFLSSESKKKLSTKFFSKDLIMIQLDRNS